MIRLPRSISPLIFTVLILSPLATSAWADDIKTIPWPMYQHNAAHTGYVNVELNPKTFKFDWKKPLGHGGYDEHISSAVVANEFVYASHSEIDNDFCNSLQAFSITDGHEVWMQSYGPHTINPPSIFDNKVYVQSDSYQSPDNALYAYDYKSGSLLFKSKIESLGDHYLSPTIFAGHVYAEGGNYGGVYSFDKDQGKIDWFTDVATDSTWTPTVNESSIITYTMDGLNIFDRLTGKLKLNIYDPNHVPFGNSFPFAPVLSDDDNVVVISAGHISNFNIKDNNISWSQGDGYIGQPAIDDKYIYAAQNTGLTCLDKNTGQTIWNWSKDNEYVNGQLIVTDNLVLISTNKAIYAISKETHKAVWSYKASGLLTLGMGHLYIVQQGELISLSVS